jgi:hypothetical protein
MLRVTNGTPMARKGDEDIKDWSVEHPLKGGILGSNSAHWEIFGLANKNKISAPGGKLLREWLQGWKETFGL